MKNVCFCLILFVVEFFITLRKRAMPPTRLCFFQLKPFMPQFTRTEAKEETELKRSSQKLVQ